MRNLFKIAVRNLIRYQRRTLLTASLITIGVVFVLVFVSVSGSFKAMITSQITDSMMGHLQIHRKGYVASIDNLPLNLNIKPKAYQKIHQALAADEKMEAFFAPPQVRRDVQQFHRNHQHSFERRRSRSGIQNRPAFDLPNS